MLLKHKQRFPQIERHRHNFVALPRQKAVTLEQRLSHHRRLQHFTRYFLGGHTLRQRTLQDLNSLHLLFLKEIIQETLLLQQEGEAVRGN